MVVVFCACLAAHAEYQHHDRSAALTTSTHAPAPEARIDINHASINHASIDELMKAPGMTRTWAARIVRFRPYRTKGDLLDRGIVTSAVYERIKNYVAHREKQ